MYNKVMRQSRNIPNKHTSMQTQVLHYMPFHHYQGGYTQISYSVQYHIMNGYVYSTYKNNVKYAQ